MAFAPRNPDEPRSALFTCGACEEAVSYHRAMLAYYGRGNRWEHEECPKRPRGTMHPKPEEPAQS